jgi:two-component sensor histidine kinase
VLATVQSTVDLSLSDAPDYLKEAIRGRIQALVNVHALFVESRWLGAGLHRLVAQELTPYRRNDEARVRIDGPDLLLEPNRAQTIAVALHELATNAAKYGAFSVAEGQVEVTWSLEADGWLVLLWTERGGPTVMRPTRLGFGTQMMEQMIRRQAGGEMRLDWRTQGLVCQISLRL